MRSTVQWLSWGPFLKISHTNLFQMKSSSNVGVGNELMNRSRPSTIAVSWTDPSRSYSPLSSNVARDIQHEPWAQTSVSIWRRLRKIRHLMRWLLSCLLQRKVGRNVSSVVTSRERIDYQELLSSTWRNSPSTSSFSTTAGKRIASTTMKSYLHVTLIWKGMRYLGLHKNGRYHSASMVKFPINQIKLGTKDST